MKGTQPEGLGEAQLEDLLEGKMAGDCILKVPWKGMRYSQVEEWSDPASEG